MQEGTIVEQIIALILALAVGSAGVATAVEKLASVPTSVDMVGLDLAEGVAASEAATGLARAAEAVPAGAASAVVAAGAALAGQSTAGQSTDGLTRVLEAVSQAADAAPAEADAGLQVAIDALTDTPANDAPGDVPPTVDVPPLPVPPVDPSDPGITPPVDVPQDPPSDVPGGRP